MSGADRAGPESGRARRGPGVPGAVAAQASVDLHEGATGWRRAWRVGRVALVVAGLAVLAVNAARWMSATPRAGAETAVGAPAGGR
ncbi:MAG: hypothetical protein K2Q09_04910 [Phycisphaerales bacterium]|nr:hypothetical protein [Phycisphaerales bacterium]